MDLYDLRQNHRINKSASESRAATRELQENNESILELKKSVQKLSLVCQAMWHLVQENTNLTEADLIETVEYLEHQANAGVRCPQCDRAQASRQAVKCLYCGTQLLLQESSGSLFKI